MKNILFSFSLLAACLFAFSSCKKEKSTNPEPAPGPTYYALGSAYANGLHAQLFSDTALQTGYHRLYISLSDSATGAAVNEAQVSVMPLMNMGTMTHAAPFENPASTTAVDQYFPAAVVFTMPGSSSQWSVQVTVLKDGVPAVMSFPVNVDPYSPERVRSFVSAADGASYFVALLQPKKPIVGVNDLELAVYKKQSMMSFPADSSLTISNTPEMPSMGHGSPGNIDPVHTGRGHYKGKVNFTMTGLWRLNLGFTAPEGPADSTTYFEISF